MKKPRVEDFDPNTAPALGSPLVDMPQIQPSAKSSSKQVAQVPVMPSKGSVYITPPTNTNASPVSSPTAKKPDSRSNRDTATPRNHDTTVSRYHDTIIEMVRKAVKEFGKEAATHRFTVEEKRAIADLMYSYARRGLKTSENEIARIAVNFLINDYQENGENSILHKVLMALNE